MRQLKVLLLIIAAAALQSCVVADRDRDRIAACGGEHPPLESRALLIAAQCNTGGTPCLTASLREA